jgi:hypothetical protein
MERRVVISLLVLAVFSLIWLGGINPAQADLIDLYNFDFGSNKSPVQAGWLQVTSRSSYSSQLGYGWDNIKQLSDNNRNGATPPEYPDMLCDYNQSKFDQTFEIDLAAGTYVIELYFYDNAAHADPLTVYLGDSSTVLATLTGLPKDTEVTRQFDIAMASDGQLDLRFGQVDTGNWQINGIRVAQEVAPVPPTLLLLGSGLLGLTFLRKGRKARKD